MYKDNSKYYEFRNKNFWCFLNNDNFRNQSEEERQWREWFRNMCYNKFKRLNCQKGVLKFNVDLMLKVK